MQLATVLGLVVLAGSDVQNDADPPSTKFAWNRADQYVPPDFEGYFPADDQAAAQRLDQFLSSQKLREEHPDEFIETVRRGLRSTKRYKSRVLSRLGNTFIWGQMPQHPAAIELMYHACGSPDHDTRHFAMYQGITVVSDRSSNLVRMLVEQYPTLGDGLQRRVHWGFEKYGDRQQTTARLVTLLDQHQEIGVAPTLAAIEAYRRLKDRDPPDFGRFVNLGRWVIAFRHRDVTVKNAATASAQLDRIIRDELELSQEVLIDSVTRIDGEHVVAVTLLDGLLRRDSTLEKIDHADDLQLVFHKPFDATLFQTTRLREFAPHFDGGLPPHARPEYSPRPLNETLAWNRKDRYQSPDFDAFFPDDPEAGKRLDQLYASRDNLQVTDRQLLATFRSGLRRSNLRPNVLFGWLSGALGWPADPYQTEIFFQASDPDAPLKIRSNAIYFGLGQWWKKSDNVLRLMHHILVTEPYDHSRGSGTRGQILWSVRKDKREKRFLADRIAATLRQPDRLSFLTLYALDLDYQQLTGEHPKNRADYEDVGTFVVALRHKTASTVKALTAEVEADLGSSRYWLAFRAEQMERRVYGFAILKGLAGVDWLTEELAQPEADKTYRLDFISPFAREALPGTELADWPEFKKFLQPSTNRP